MASDPTPTPSTITPSFNISINPQPPTPCKNFDRVLRFLAIALLLLLFLFALTLSIAWLLLHPHLPAVKAESLSASRFNISDSGFSAKYVFQINITNSNEKINLWIDHFSLRMVYKKVVVSKVDLSEPYEGILIPRGMHSLKFNFTNELNHNERKKIVRDMHGDYRRGFISFDIIINIRVIFRSGSILPSKQKLVTVSCKKLNVVVSSSPDDFGTPGEAKDCVASYS